uniref:Uncharacterized protein n=1 Tax=Anguilla anguilla TaxID=7936 RepID=A0A0E9WXW9_ANGAN
MFLYYLMKPVLKCTLYIQCCTLQRYTLFFGTILYSNSNSSLLSNRSYRIICVVLVVNFF